MDAMERRHHEQLDVVLLNVDNPRWQPQVDSFGVNGIPQLNFFDGRGERLGQAVGARSTEELELLGAALVAGEPLPALAGTAPTSLLTQEPQSPPRETPIAPRSHG
jgi:hypothetical protein